MLRRRDVATGLGAGALAPVVGELTGVVVVEREEEPSRVDAHHDHEERQREEHVHGLEHLDHAVGRAPIEVVDVEDDPIDVGLLFGIEPEGGPG